MKKVGYIVLGIIGLWVVLLLVNGFLMFNHQKPFPTFKEISYEEGDNHITEYYSLGYKIILKEKGFIKESMIRPIWVKMTDREYFILDETGDTCIENRTYFYETEHFKYYFSCNKKIVIEINNKRYSLTEALNNGKVTIDSLKENGLSFGIESKVQYTMEPKADNTCKFLEGDASKLIQKKDKLYYYCLNDVNIYVNKNYSSLETAFNSTIKIESILAGLKKETSYESGATMYLGSGYKILMCGNGDAIIGPTGMEYFDIFCK